MARSRSSSRAPLAVVVVYCLRGERQHTDNRSSARETHEALAARLGRAKGAAEPMRRVWYALSKGWGDETLLEELPEFPSSTGLQDSRGGSLLAAVTLGMVWVCLVSAGSAAASGYKPSAAFSLHTLAPPPLLAASLGLLGASAPATGPTPFTVTLRVSHAVVRNGRMAKLTGRVTPRAAHGRVELQVRAGGRWRTIASRSLSKSSAFAFTTRLTGVGGHLLRVLRPADSGRAQGVSVVVELIVPGRRTVRSHGGALHLSLGAVRVSAPKGAIGKGKTLSISVGVPTGFGAEGASSVAGGPYLLSTSQGEPHKPVTVTIGYDAGLLAPGDKPLFLHGWTVTHRWVPEITTMHGHSVSATLDSFSPIDAIDWGTYYAGMLTGNRADLPSGCGPPPSWIDSVTLPDSNQDPLPACFSSKSDQAEAVLNVVNNRGYAQTVTVSGAKIDVAKSVFAASFEGQIGKLLAQLSSGNGPSAFVLGPGESASITIDRPPPQQAAQEIHIDPAGKTASGVGELAWALLTTAKDQIGVPVDMENCVQAAVYNTVSADRGPDSAIGQMHSCVDAASGLSGTAKAVLEKLAYGLLVDDFFYKLLDLEDSEVYPAKIEFTIPGSNPTFTSPDIHISPLDLGTVPDGQQTVVHLSASGGVAPYRFYVWNEPANAAKVPRWVTLGTDGTLTIEPPSHASGEVSFAVYAFDADGEHSPFAREVVHFVTSGAISEEEPHSEEPPPTGSWLSGTPVDLPAMLVSCASKLFCAAVWEGNATVGHASVWTSPKTIDPGNQLSPPSCPSESFCVAVDSVGNVLTYDGSNWSSPTRIDPPRVVDGVEYPKPLTAVSCASTSFCMAVDEEGEALTYNGGGWSAPREAASETDELVSVSCPSESFCVTVSYQGNVVIYENGSWSKPSLLDQHGNWQYGGLVSVSCGSPSFCLAVDGVGDAWTYNGSSWSEELSRFDGLYGSYKPAILSCAGQRCLLANNALTFDDTTLVKSEFVSLGGVYAGAYGTIDSVTCPSESYCGLVVGEGDLFSYEGTAVSAPTAISGAVPVSMSCVASEFCMAVDIAGHALRFNGSSWQPPTYILPDQAATVACASVSFCVAAANYFGEGYVTTYDGSSWTTPARVGEGFNSVSCPSEGFVSASLAMRFSTATNGKRFLGRSCWSRPVDLSRSASAPTTLAKSRSSLAAVGPRSRKSRRVVLATPQSRVPRLNSVRLLVGTVKRLSTLNTRGSLQRPLIQAKGFPSDSLESHVYHVCFVSLLMIGVAQWRTTVVNGDRRFSSSAKCILGLRPSRVPPRRSARRSMNAVRRLLTRHRSSRRQHIVDISL